MKACAVRALRPVECSLSAAWHQTGGIFNFFDDRHQHPGFLEIVYFQDLIGGIMPKLFVATLITSVEYVSEGEFDENYGRHLTEELTTSYGTSENAIRTQVWIAELNNQLILFN